MKLVCPNRNSKEWQLLESQVGEYKAYATWAYHGFDFPAGLGTTSQLKKTLGIKNTMSNAEFIRALGRIKKYNKDNGTSHSISKEVIGESSTYSITLHPGYINVESMAKLLAEKPDIIRDLQAKSFYNSYPKYYYTKIGEGQYEYNGDIYPSEENTIYDAPNTTIKPGVPELFESNPELASQIYEALGFNNEKIVETAKGSTYRYLASGKTQRFKKVEGKEYEPQDILTFVPNYDWIKSNNPNWLKQNNLDTEIEYEQYILNKVQGKDKVWIIDSKGNKIETNQKAKETDKIFIAFGTEDGKVQDYIPVSKDPVKGFYTYDSRIYKNEKGERTRQRHLGNKVVDVRYKELTPQQKQQAQQLYSQYLESLNKPNTNPVLQGNQEPNVILPIGTSGSGKSTFIKSLPQENLVVIEPDAMRVEFTGDMNNKSKDKEIYEEAAKRAIAAIKQGKQVVFDTTNLTKEKRLPFIEAIKKAIPTANIQYKLMELNPELAKQRIKAQLARGENRAAVSDATIDRHAESYKQMLEDIKSEPISEYKELGSKQDIENFANFVAYENSDFSKIGNINQFRDYIMSKNFAAIEEFLVVNNKIDRKC